MTEPRTIAVTVRYFAILREHLGRSEEQLTVPEGTTAGDILPMVTKGQPHLATLQRSLMLMVNADYAPKSRILADGDELAFIPPVSGGEAAETKRFLVTDTELDPRLVESLVATDDAGALVTFTGTVRNNARGRAVVALDYEAYVPAAEKQLSLLADEVTERWPGMRIAVHHRTGYLVPGVASVIIACASPHRAEALAAVGHTIDRLKQVVPIWKKEHYEDGSTWIGSEADYQAEIRQER